MIHCTHTYIMYGIYVISYLIRVKETFVFWVCSVYSKRLVAYGMI